MNTDRTLDASLVDDRSQVMTITLVRGDVVLAHMTVGEHLAARRLESRDAAAERAETLGAGWKAWSSPLSGAWYVRQAGAQTSSP